METIKNKTYRNMLVVKNNPEILAYEWLRGLHAATGACYTCGQLEKAPTTGTLHIQAYVNFKKPQRFSRIQKYDKQVHIDPVRIDNGAHNYCMKEETRVEGPWEFGEKPLQRNNKTDWQEVRLNAKRSRFEEIPADIYVRNYANIQKIAKDNLTFSDKDDLRGIWIYGPAGCGKSRLAREICYSKGATKEDIYPKPRNEWWDGYKDQKYVILDDMDPYARALGGKLKDWTDRYGICLSNKGSGISDMYEHFIVTSQYTIREIFTDEKGKCDEATIDALERRFKRINFSSDGTIKIVERSTPPIWDTTQIDLKSI